MATTIYDVVVIGGGPIGLATAYEVAKAGSSVIVLEQNNFFNQAGSSGDLMRMYRTMYTEDFMADLAKESLDMWAELETDAGVSLRAMTGLLNFGDPTVGKGSPEGSLLDPVKNLERLKMPFKLYDKEDAMEKIQKKWPFKNMPKDYRAVFAPDNGIINVPLMLRTVHRLAKDYGAHTRQQVKVNNIQLNEKDKTVWDVVTGLSTPDSKPTIYKGRKIVITAGAYTNHVLSSSFEKLRLNLKIWEMTANYFNVNAGPNGTVFPSMWFQFAHDVQDPNTGKPRSRLFYGFPAVEWGPPNLARISVDAATNIITDPDARQPSVINAQDIADTQDFVRNHCVGVDSTVPAFSLTCLQTNVYDNMFVLDYIPHEYYPEGPENSVMVFTAGWAMKFVPMLGRALKEMAVDGSSRFKRKEFEITRSAVDDEGNYLSIIHDDSQDKSAAGFMAASAEEGVQESGSSRHYQRIAVKAN